MPSVTIRKIPEEIHSAIIERARRNGRSMAEEIRLILERAAAPEGRVKLGTLLTEINHKAKLTDEELALFMTAHDQTLPRECLE